MESKLPGKIKQGVVIISGQQVRPVSLRMRLLLLRPVSRCSNEENDVVEIVKSSFRNYVEESKRSDSEIAMLLAREWQCLQSLAPTSPSMQATNMSTTRAPMPPPSPAFGDVKLPGAAGGDSYQSQVLDSPLTSMMTGDAAGMSSKALSRPSGVFKPYTAPSSSNIAGQDNTTIVSYDHSNNKLP